MDRYTTADAMTDALVHGGVSHIFLNSGTDYPALIECWARRAAEGQPCPRIVTCPHEAVAFNAAQGYAQLTGRPQGVFVHVDVGTQNIGGAISNAFRGRIPVLVFAGLAPFTDANERLGARDNFIQYLQNTMDQNGIVREYVKYFTELRGGANAGVLVSRALQLAKSDVAGPVYLTATREALSERAEPFPGVGGKAEGFRPAETSSLSREALGYLTRALFTAKSPLIVTGYAGRKPEAVGALVRLAELLAIPVCEPPASGMNFPTESPLYFGPDIEEAVSGADLVLVVDCDVPWLPSSVSLPDSTRLLWLDVDPLKEAMPLWHFPAERFFRADATQALHLIADFSESILNDAAAGKSVLGEGFSQSAYRAAIDARRARTRARHEARAALCAAKERPGEDGRITPEYLTACVSDLIGEDAIVLDETVTNQPAILRHLKRTKPLTRFVSGGAGLGWAGGAAIGMKLAAPDRDVVALTGDGSYIFSCPTAVQWTARKYGAPFLTVVYNNGGWIAPRLAVDSQYPGGFAARGGEYWTGLQPAPDYAGVAEAAGGALALRVSNAAELPAALAQALAAVRGGRSAVVDAVL